MMLSAFGFHIPNVLFFSLLIVVFVGAMLISSAKKKKKIKARPSFKNHHIFINPSASWGIGFIPRQHSFYDAD